MQFRTALERWRVETMGNLRRTPLHRQGGAFDPGDEDEDAAEALVMPPGVDDPGEGEGLQAAEAEAEAEMTGEKG